MKLFVVSFVFFLIPGLTLAQSIQDLQKKKADASKEIEYTTKLLNETQKNEKSSLGNLRLIDTRIQHRNSIISNINDEIELYQLFIDNNILAAELLKNDIEKLKAEYATLVQWAYKNKSASDELLFILSAENFNQAYRRLLYFRRYTEYRKNQAETIVTVQKVLDESVQKLEQQQATKKELVGENMKEKQVLDREKNQQNSELRKLQRQKGQLQKKLNQQRQIEQELEREIQRIIEEEARKSREAGGGGFALTPEQKLVGDNFEQNKSRLPWPVERGVIVEHFGVHQHPVLTNVQVQNNGVNIATEPGSNVRTIFNGEVSRVFGISGGNTAVIIRHGKFLSVYSNLREVTVKKGDKVTTKQNIGKVYRDKDDTGKSILKFQIWKESTKLDPEIWIGR